MRIVFKPITNEELGRNVIFLALLLYFAVNTFYFATPLFITRLFLFIIISISLIFFINSIPKRIYLWDRVLLLWSVFFLVNFLGFTLSGNLSNLIHFAQIRNILFITTIFYASYQLTICNKLKENHLIILFITMTPILIYNFSLAAEARRITTQMDDIVNNASYYLLYFLPYLFLLRKKTRIGTYFFLLLYLFLIIQGAKRGAILSGGLFLLVYIYYEIFSGSRKFRTARIIAGFVFSFVLVFFIVQIVQDNLFLISRFQRMAAGDTSLRDIVFKQIWYGWRYADEIKNLLFGFGFAGSLKLTGGTLAHNDWLELLASYGPFGIAIYFVLILSFLKLCKSKYINKEYKYLVVSLFLIWASTSVYSMWYSTYATYPMVILIAHITAQNRVNIDKRHKTIQAF